MVEFVDELKRLPQSMGVQYMIEEAKAGEYHDYKNEKYTCGKVEASRKLRIMGFIDLARRIEEGEFDEEADETDKALVRKDLLENGFTEAQASKMFGV
jgi:hypothetical protein